MENIGLEHYPYSSLSSAQSFPLSLSFKDFTALHSLFLTRLIVAWLYFFCISRNGLTLSHHDSPMMSGTTAMVIATARSTLAAITRCAPFMRTSTTAAV